MTRRTEIWLLAALLVGCDDGDGGSGSVTDLAVTDMQADVRQSDAQLPDVGAVEDVGPTVDVGPQPIDSAVDSAVVDAQPDASQPDVGPDMGPVEDVIYRPCAPEERVGGFTTSLEEGFTAVQGQVFNSVSPGQLLVETAAEGVCRLLQPPMHFCDPGCAVGMTCGPAGCVPLPTAVTVGEVAVSGLTAPVTMNANAPVYFYTNRSNLPHPGFAEGGAIELSAAGADLVEAFSLQGRGLTALVPEGDSVPLVTGQAVALSWAAPGPTSAARIRIDLNIANHGGTPGNIECVVPDTGAFALPVALTDQLLALGASGFPRIVLVRETIDSQATAVGCVDFRVQSSAVLDVEIPGLISCSFDEDCPEGQICRADLTCGEG